MTNIPLCVYTYFCVGRTEKEMILSVVQQCRGPLKLGLQQIPLIGVWILGYLNEQIPNDLKCIPNFAIACQRLPYLPLVHMNYCLYFSTCLYYELANCKIGLLKPRSTGVNKVTSNCTLYKTQVKQTLNTNFCYPSTKMLTNIQVNQIFLAALIETVGVLINLFTAKDAIGVLVL